MPSNAKKTRTRTVARTTITRAKAAQKGRSARSIELPERRTQSLRQQNVMAGLETIDVSAAAILDALKGLRNYVQELEADLETTRRSATESFEALREEMEEQAAALEARLEKERRGAEEQVERMRLEGERYAAQLHGQMEKEKTSFSMRLEKTTEELNRWKERCKKLESRLDLARDYIDKPLSSGARTSL